MDEMKLVSWNVNGIRAVAQKDFENQLKSLNPDIMGIQETKAQDDQVREAIEAEGYHLVSNSAVKKGYSGTAVLSKEKPLSVVLDLGIEDHDQEGRVITAEFKDFYFVTVYVPNSQNGLKRLPYREQWDLDFLKHCQALEEKKPVIVCGDLNVAHQAIDLKNPKSNYNKNAGYTQQEIDGLQRFIDNGFVDSFRFFYPDKEEAYTWWSYRMKARDRNIGWRIDYFLVSQGILDRLVKAEIHSDYMGSDHCPISIEIK